MSKTSSKDLAVADRMQVINLDSHNTLVERFAKFVYEKTKDGNILNERDCAKYIQHLKSGAEVKEKDVKRWISQARRYCEKNLLHYIIRVPSEGWRIAVGDERPRYAGKIVHISARWNDRALDALGALRKNEIDSLYRDYMLRYQKSLQSTSGVRRKFSEGWLTYIEREKERIADEQKQLVESGK